MAIVKISDVKGEKILSCFDTLDDVPYLEEDIVEEDTEPEDKNPFE